MDGIPVNDMESGQVYWSNWDGLKEITKTMQVQRGLGASKLAVVSVGGTMNIITNGIDQKQQTTIKREWGNNGFSNTSLSYNSGAIKNKFGFTFAGSHKSGNGWVDQTWTDAWSYFAKFQYRPNTKHLISIGANGAPQKHGQRLTKLPIVVYDKKLAESLGINTDSMLKAIQPQAYTTMYQGDRSIQWNPDMGILNGQAFGDRQNFYHKPLININHFWNVSESTTISTVAYASFGTGGGTSYSGSTPGRDTTTGYYKIQDKYNANTTTISSGYSTTEHKSSTVLRSQNNNHNWYGILSTATTRLKKYFTLTYGIDARYYKGTHTQTVYDLIGGDYFVEQGTNINPNLDALVKQNFVKRKDDIFGRQYYGYVKWGGLFFQTEFKTDKISAFITATGSYTGYNRIDYYQKKDLVLPDTIMYNAIGYYTTVTYQGVTYNKDSPQLRTATTGWKWQPGGTIKGGANYNIDSHHNVFLNLGYMNIPQKFNNVFDYKNKPYKDIKPQEIGSFEVGYGIKYSKLNINVNAYYTTWNNKPYTRTNVPPNNYSYNINGIREVHEGIEFEGTYKPIKELEFEGIASFGNWYYDSQATVYLQDENGFVVQTLDFSAKGVHTSDAAQHQLGGSVRYMPIKGAYIKTRYTYFSKNYANFDPTTLTGEFADRESWIMPTYSLIDLNMGYEFPTKGFRVNCYATVNNVLNRKYINDGNNNGVSGAAGFNAASATVFFGTGRTFVIGTKVSF